VNASNAWQCLARIHRGRPGARVNCHSGGSLTSFFRSALLHRRVGTEGDAVVASEWLSCIRAAPTLIQIKAPAPRRFNCCASNDRWELCMRHHIEGTTLFDGDQAQKGYALNRMCFSFNSAENRMAFVDNEEAYCTKFALTAEQRMAVKSRNVLKLIEAGGNVYYLAKLAGILGLNVQDIGAQQTGMSVEAFKEKLVAAGR
jgi:protocatechuate 4,5-dioxygenase alpha chain